MSTLLSQTLTDSVFQVVDQLDVIRFAAAAGSVIIRKDDIPNEALVILTEAATKNSTFAYLRI